MVDMSDVAALFVVLLIFYSIAAVRPQTFLSSVAPLDRALPLLRLRELLAGRGADRLRVRS